MKNMWLTAGIAALALAGPAWAQDPMVEGCEKFKADIAKQKAACAEENAAAAKITCKGKDDMNAALKLFQACGKKAVSAATSGAAASAGATATASATKEWKCKAVDMATPAKDIAEATAPKMSECMAALKEKVKAARCAAGGADKIEYLHQNFVVGTWTKGTKIALACK